MKEDSLKTEEKTMAPRDPLLREGPNPYNSMRATDRRTSAPTGVSRTRENKRSEQMRSTP